MSTLLPNGIGQTLGDSLVTNTGPLLIGGNVWFVDSVTGADAAAPRGLSPEYPLATIGQAYTNASADDIIVLFATHSETLTSALTIAKAGLTIVGAGKSGGLPTAQLKLNHASNNLLSVTTDTIRIQNVKFAAPQVASTGKQIVVTASDFNLINCYFEMDGNSDGVAVDLSSASAVSYYIDGCTFKSTATAKTDRPAIGLSSTIGQSTQFVKNTTFDGGTMGWNTYAMEISNGATQVRCENINMLLGSDIRFVVSTGWFQHGTRTGSSRLVTS